MDLRAWFNVPYAKVAPLLFGQDGEVAKSIILVSRYMHIARPVARTPLSLLELRASHSPEARNSVIRLPCAGGRYAHHLTLQVVSKDDLLSSPTSRGEFVSAGHFTWSTHE